MLNDRHIAPDEELDEMVLIARAIEGHLVLYSDRQRDKMMEILRGLLSYEASRPAWHRPASNVVDFETALVKSRLTRAISTERRSAIANTVRVLQHGVNKFGDCIFDDIY